MWFWICRFSLQLCTSAPSKWSNGLTKVIVNNKHRIQQETERYEASSNPPGLNFRSGRLHTLYCSSTFIFNFFQHFRMIELLKQPKDEVAAREYGCSVSCISVMLSFLILMSVLDCTFAKVSKAWFCYWQCRVQIISTWI